MLINILRIQHCDTEYSEHTQRSAIVSEKLCNHKSDHIPPWAIPLITYLATADPPSLLWPHLGICPGKERGLHHSILPGVRGTTFTVLADSMSWLSCVSPLDITHDILETWASQRPDAGLTGLTTTTNSNKNHLQSLMFWFFNTVLSGFTVLWRVLCCSQSLWPGKMYGFFFSLNIYKSLFLF